MINIAEILKKCPEGTKLYSPLFGEVEFLYVSSENNILVATDRRTNYCFTANGILYMYKCHSNAECLLFPAKGQTWEGWKLPVVPKFKVGDWAIDKYVTACVFQITKILDNSYEVTERDGHVTSCLQCDIEDNSRLWTIADAKDGDVLATTDCPFIYRKTDYNNDLAYYYAGIDGNGDFCEGCLKRTLYHFGPVANVAPATKEQRDLLFKKMKEAGYTWDEKKKELKKIHKHYDIANFKPKQWVLVRDDDEWEWALTRFSHLSNGSASLFICINGASFQQCIPLEGNETLLGTTDPCPEKYINW